MNVSYGIGVTNRYALFMGDEDSDPLDMLSKVKEEPDTKKSAPAPGPGTGSGHGKKSTGANVQPLNSTENRMTKDKNKGASNQTPTSNSISSSNNVSKNKDVSSNKDANHQAGTGNQNAAPGGNRERRRGPGDQGNNRTQKDFEGKPYGNKGNENRQSNRPPRQERIVRPSNQVNSTNAGFGNNAATTNDSASGQPGSGNVFNKDQKDFEERKNRRNREDRGPGPFNTEFKDRGDEGYRGSSGRSRGSMGSFGRGRGGRGRGNFNRGKREYDRQSGSDKTGIKATEKRDGSGAHNWGTVTDELEGQTNAGSEETHDMADRSGDENTFENAEHKEETGGTEEEVKEAEQVEEAAKEMTLEEWKQQQDEKRAVPKFNLRKPGEGEDNAQWKKTYVLKKKPDEEEEEYEEIVVEEEIHKGRNKKVIDIEINFGRDENRDNRRGRGRGGMRGGRGRGGMDGGRGGGPMGEGRGGRGGRSSFRGRDSKEQAAPKMDNWEEFPSLAAA